MPSDRSGIALRHLLYHIERAERFLSGLTETEFVADARTVYAVTRCFEWFIA